MSLKIPPLLVASLAGALAYGLHRLRPVPFDFPGRPVTVTLLFAAAFLVVALAVHRFRSTRTTVDPMHPERASSLVTGGVYRFSRNPMYLGFALALIAWGLHLSDLLGVAAGPALFVLWADRLQIVPEEKALEARFGEAWREYRSRVRRWI